MLNSNIPSFKCFVRQSYFTKKQSDSNIFHACYAFGIQSIAGKILTFHIMTDYGMLRSRVPISEIYLHATENDIPYHYKQLWDCFGNDVTVTEFEYLQYKRCQVILRDKTLAWATYMFTIDWQHNPYSNEPTDYKCGHVLVADDGYLLCMPNNRIYWKDSNWVTRDFPIDKREIKVDTELLSTETVSDRWVSEDTDSFYYDIKNVTKDLEN
jgi:hypothetical protein